MAFDPGPIADEGCAWRQEDEVSTFPVTVGTLADLGIVDSSFTLMATVFRDPEARDDGGQYVSDQAIFAQNEYDNSGNLTNLHCLVRDGCFNCNFYRSGYPGGVGSRHTAAKGQWVHFAFVLDKDSRKCVLYVDGEEMDAADCPPLDDNPGNRNVLRLGQYAHGRSWKGQIKGARVLRYAWKPSVVPLTLTAEQGSSGLEISCTNMGGNVLAQITGLTKEQPLHALLASIDEAAPPSAGARWQVVLPNMTCPGRSQCDSSIAELFEL